MGIEVPVELHAAVDGRETSRRADPGRDRLLGDDPRDADVVVRERRQRPFDQAQQPVQPGRLVVVEDQAVQGVDHDRRPRRSGRQPAEHAGLRAVRVDDVVPAPLDQAVDLGQRDQVREGVNAASELGNDHQVRRLARAREQVALRPLVDSRRQGHLEVGQSIEALDAQQGVLLGPADDQPGDQVQDPVGIRHQGRATTT